MLNNPSFGQKIEYDIPEDYKKDVEANDYKRIVDASIATISKRYKIERVKM